MNYVFYDLGVSKNRGIPKNGWFIMEHPIKIKMDDLGVPLFVETPMCFMICVFHHFSIHPECLNLS